MRCIAVMNQKGGVGKTTTSVNLAAGLAAAGRQVCLIDLDPQGHTTLHLGSEVSAADPTMYDVFTGSKTVAEVRRLVCNNLWVAPANIDLAGVEMELADAEQREIVLRDALTELLQVQTFDYVIMDCPPSLGVLTVNALTAASEVFIPLQPHFLALQGLSKLLETTALITRRLNRDLRVTGIVFCMYETGTRLAADVIDDLMIFMDQSDPNAPWAQARIFESRIRRNIKLAESPGFGKSIFAYEPRSAGALDYGALVKEVINQETQEQPNMAA